MLVKVFFLIVKFNHVKRILHVKTNALWTNVDYNASSSGNNLNTILVQKEATVVLERNIFFGTVLFPKE